MYHESAQGVDEGMINIHYYYYNLRQNEAQSVVQNQQTRELIRVRKTSHKHNNNKRHELPATKYKVTNSPRGCPSGGVYVPYILYSLAR